MQVLQTIRCSDIHPDMTNIVEQIFDALDGTTPIAKGTGMPVQTVNDWLRKGPPEIPPWRRPAVLDFARESGKLAKLTPECLAYLQSQERTVGKSPTPTEQGEAA